MLDRLRAEPGVQSASLVENSLVSGWISTNRLLVEGEEPRTIQMNRVGPGFFDTMGLPLVAGRGFDLRDDAGGAGACSPALGCSPWHSRRSGCTA